jgi:hypothetical protein
VAVRDLIGALAVDAGTPATGGNGILADSVRDYALSTFGAAAPDLDNYDQGVAIVIGAPGASNITTVLGANSAIASAFVVLPSYFALGELGGACARAGQDSETTTGTVNLTVELTRLSVTPDLLIGIYGGAVIGSGVTWVTLLISANSAPLISQTFIGYAHLPGATRQRGNLAPVTDSGDTAGCATCRRHDGCNASPCGGWLTSAGRPARGLENPAGRAYLVVG